MDPKKAQRLAKTAAIKEFIPLMLKEMKKLDTVSGIKTKNPTEGMIEVEARKLAIETMGNILKPLLESSGKVGTFNVKEYIT